jgi:hypothetical protein
MTLCGRRAPGAAADSPPLPAGQQPARGALAGGTGPRRASAREGQGLPPARQHTCTDPGRGWTATSPVPRTVHGEAADRAGKTGRSLASPSVSLLMPMSGLDIPVLCGRRSRGAATEGN